MRQVAGSCKRLQEGFESIASAPADRRKGVLINTALAGAEQCGCEKVDVDGLSAVVWYLLAGDDPGLRWLPLKIDAGASRLIPGDATAEAMAKIVAEEPRVGFAPH